MARRKNLSTEKPLQIKATVTNDEWHSFRKKAKTLGMTVQGRLALLIREDIKPTSPNATDEKMEPSSSTLYRT